MSPFAVLGGGEAASGEPMDALDLLEQQHRDVRDLLDRLAGAHACVAGVDTTIDAVLRAVEAHVRVEEAYVYGACASKLRGDGRTWEVVEDRACILAAVRVLGSMSPADPQFGERVAALSERFGRHADKEEDAVFPKLKRSLTDEALDALGDELERAHVRLLLEDELFEDQPFGGVDVAITNHTVRPSRLRSRRRSLVHRSGIRQKVRPPSA